MAYNGATNGSNVGVGVGVSSAGGGGSGSDGPQNKKIRTGGQQPGDQLDSHQLNRVSLCSFLLLTPF